MFILETKTKVIEGTLQLADADLHITRYARETESENPERREFDYQSLPGGGEFDPHALGVGNLNCTLDFMKSLAWRAIMEDGVLEDFRGKDCAFVANWLRGKDLKKLCAVFESI